MPGARALSVDTSNLTNILSNLGARGNFQNLDESRSILNKLNMLNLTSVIESEVRKATLENFELDSLLSSN